MEHWIKIKSSYADRVLSGQKKFEVRYNDRDYQLGDILSFRVIDNKGNDVKYHNLNGNKYLITYIHTGLGILDDYVVLGIEPYEEKKTGKNIYNYLF